MFKKGEYFIILLMSLVVFFGIFAFKSRFLTSKNIGGELFINIPDGWELRLEDDLNCYSVVAHKVGTSQQMLDQFLVSKNIATKDWIESVKQDTNAYSDHNTPNIVVFGATGVLNENTIYLKTGLGNIYVIAINFDKTLSEGNIESLSCKDPKPLVNDIIQILQ